MPIRSRRNTASPSSSSAARSTPSTTTRPRSAARSRRRSTSRLDLPEPEGPTTLTVVAGRDHEVDAAQDLHRTGGAGQGEMHVLRARSSSGGLTLATGRARDTRQEEMDLRVAGPQGRPAAWLVLAAPLRSRGPAQPCRLAVLGDSLTAGYGVPSRGRAFRSGSRRRCGSSGIDCEVRQCRRLRRHLGRRGRRGSTGCWPTSRPTCWSSSAATTRCAPSRSSSCGRISTTSSPGASAGVKVMLAGMLAPPNLGQDYSQAFAQGLHRPRGRAPTCRSIRSSWRAWSSRTA